MIILNFTTSYELTTAITNVFIFIVSFYGFIKIKKKEKLWKIFFLLMSLDSFLGCIVHGISMTIEMNVLLWIILSILFTFTINTYLISFLKYKARYVIILSVLLSFLLIVEIYNSMDFILTFTIYVIVALLISVYFVIKEKYKNKNYYLISIIILFIGGIFMLSDIHIGCLNHNGILHIFMTITMILLYLGIKKND